MPKESSNQNVIAKTLAVLRAFTDKQMEWGVTELARYLEVPVSSLHRILKTLRGENILQVSPESGKYKFGPEMVRMASIISAKVDIKSVARPFLERLSETVDESVYLALYHSQHKKLSFVDCVHGSKALQYVLEIGVLQPVHIAASGKVILAHMEPAEVAKVLEQEGIDEEGRQKISAELERIRIQGYAMTANERKVGALSIGAPLFDASQKVIGSLICVIPVNSFDETKKDLLVLRVKEEAAGISRALGFSAQTLPF
ncbi:IclR family transcriptional regulator [Brevibacillus marinus]|uniref:IclR family transcriptional regulator n=1 Tax=Brevibacillus marinus TaxID=2496837 RepID=UPI000F84D148|nr:IclR family transcriptional regulator [Brevibacillus marinus]